MNASARRPGRFFLTLAMLLAGSTSYVLQAGSAPPALAVAVGAGEAQTSAVAPMNSPCKTGVGWSNIPAPDDGSYMNALYGVASISPGDAWAVGQQYESGLSSYIGLIEHWNGTRWSVVPGFRYAISLRGVAAVSTNDVWAVGWMGGYGFSPFTEHWDGSQWTYVPSLASGARQLYGVAAVSANDVWAVGRSSTGVLIFHWDGSQWTMSPAPTIANGVLYGVTAVSSNDVWAVGTSNNAETVTLHWNGTQWSRIASPNSGAYINVLTSISAAGAGNIWAVGYWATSGVDYHGYTLQWDGAQWNTVANPTGPTNRAAQPDDPTPTGVYLYGVTATTKGQVWAVGRNLQNTGSTGVTLYLQGDTWTAATNPNPGYANTRLYAVAAFGSSSPWAVGDYDTSSYGYTRPLAEQYVSGCPTQAPAHRQ